MTIFVKRAGAYAEALGVYVKRAGAYAEATDLFVKTGGAYETAGNESGYAYESWSGPGWFDASDASTITTSGGNITAMLNKVSGGGDLTAAGTAGRLVVSAAAQNGLDAISVTRDISGFTTAPRLGAGTSSALSQLGQGSDKPFTMICAYKPTDANTGYIWSWSASLSASEQQSALVRRAATACSYRRLITAPGVDANFGTGQVSGGSRIVAISFTGTTASIWDTSTTAAVSGAASDEATFSNAVAFYLFAARSADVSLQKWAQTQCNMLFFEARIADSAKSDADVQQAISDFATKWGITLS